MIWAVWSGIEEDQFFTKFLLYKNKKIIKNINYINDIFLQREKFFQYAKNKKIQLVNLNQVKNSDHVDLFIFFDMPNFDHSLIKSFLKYRKKFVLIINESKDIYPHNFKKKYHKYFKFIFTWNDDQVDNKKYFKLYWGVKLLKNYLTKIRKEKLICMINTNRIINYDKTLYSLRLKIIRWFENNSFNEFDLYGVDWDKRFFYFKSKIFRIINRISFVTKFLRYDFKNYRGAIKPSLINKITILKKYKFSIIIENSLTNGWISEKIFHCFFSSTVPIYLGAPNVSE